MVFHLSKPKQPRGDLVWLVYGSTWTRACSHPSSEPPACYGLAVRTQYGVHKHAVTVGKRWAARRLFHAVLLGTDQPLSQFRPVVHLHQVDCCFRPSHQANPANQLTEPTRNDLGFSPLQTGSGLQRPIGNVERSPKLRLAWAAVLQNASILSPFRLKQITAHHNCEPKQGQPRPAERPAHLTLHLGRRPPIENNASAFSQTSPPISNVRYCYCRYFHTPPQPRGRALGISHLPFPFPHPRQPATPEIVVFLWLTEARDDQESRRPGAVALRYFSLPTVALILRRSSPCRHHRLSLIKPSACQPAFPASHKPSRKVARQVLSLSNRRLLPRPPSSVSVSISVSLARSRSSPPTPFDLSSPLSRLARSVVTPPVPSPPLPRAPHTLSAPLRARSLMPFLGVVSSSRLFPFHDPSPRG
ncbi:hypothetical protein ACJZ2D_013083 [Fusarium nematophilum]